MHLVATKHKVEGGGTQEGGERNDPVKVGRKENSGRKCREEGENEMLGVRRYRLEGNFMAYL